MTDAAPDWTRELAELGARIDYAAAPEEAREATRHCLLDWLGVTWAGCREPLVAAMRRALRPEDAGREATLIGLPASSTSAPLAALINGAAGHALDFDDTHSTMSGHPSVPVIPAALALAEALGRNGEDLLTAILTGIEIECRVGAIVNPGHYRAGFHATGTLGTFGAAAACARLLDLDPERWLHALGLAGTQAAGLKASFGTMAKPLHAGKAAHDGLLAATLAAEGFTGNTCIVECRQGVADAMHGSERDRHVLAEMADRWLVTETLFKYHAACYLTHSTIEGALELRSRAGLDAGEVTAVEVFVPPTSLDVCNIGEPATGLEGKFSLRATAALALLGDDTAALGTYSDSRVGAGDLVRMRDAVRVRTSEGVSATATPIVVRTRDGRELEACVDVGRPATDLAAQRAKLEGKFLALTAPILGADEAAALAARALGAESLDSPAALLQPGPAEP
ncbi:MAG: MmgE/PrpD family protein [Thermoanaerobaculia bacterium]|nr:MmgE/PrpD family protein [Thermoanaerobaculia bacterium]